MTADDYIYWWKYEANNKTLNPVPPSEMEPVALNNVTKEDKYTVTYHFAKPNPRRHQFNLPGSTGPNPSNFMKQFHPEFVGKEKVKKMAEEVGLSDWNEYYERMAPYTSAAHPDYEHQSPTLRPYIAVKRTETSLILERNPYFPFVDTEGNQLPYIDKLRLNLSNDEEMVSTKAATGEATFSAQFLTTKDMPLYKKNEKQENYTTLTYTKPWGAVPDIDLNLTHKDPKLRALFQNKKFRIALSHAINRKDINNKVFYGKASPMQSTVPPMNQFFKEKYAQTYTEFNLQKARNLLDEIGMKDRNGDGWRELPNKTMTTMEGKEVKLDGSTFKPTLLYCQFSGLRATPILELITKTWQEIGINIKLKMVSQELFNERANSNMTDILIWTNDCALDITFGDLLHISKSFAPGTSSGRCSPWPAWVSWRATHDSEDSAEGMEPPEQIKELIEASNKLGFSPNKSERLKAGNQLVESQANNLWTIGTVGMVPQPIIISNKLHNVPEKGLWDWGLRFSNSYNPAQFYLDD